jgi:hypothetical protein
MSSDRRSRPGGPPRRRPAEDEYEEPRQPRRDPRRRTAYVPRQGAPRPTRPPEQPSPGEARRRRGPDSRRQRSQQPQHRSRREEPEYPAEDPQDTYEAYPESHEVDDDHVIDDERVTAPPPRQRRRSQRGYRSDPGQQRGHDRYEDAYPDPRYEPEYDDEYDDYDEGYEDSFIDEDDWYEEEAAAGAYSPPRQRSPRQSRAAPRPSFRISRPNLPRPAMPSRIKQAALVQDRSALALIGVLLLSTAATALLVMNRVDGLAPGFATHVSASGIPEQFRSETALWRLPLMAGALFLMNLVLAWFFGQYSRFSARFLLGTSLIVHALIWVALLRLAF